ncbi:DUF3889 domain-containing protein [Metabacillus sp. 84]|uniref:DUF3889 domain-containing protein n=1 Tax=unclassified Metabacillus TaxID=2675274 RepID=UPI003CF76A0B
MKKWLSVLFAALMLSAGAEPQEVYAREHQQEPAYAKWSRIAIQEAKKKYPDAKLLDYLYIGREDSGRTAKEKFKLWVRRDSREFGLFVTVEFEKDTQKVKAVTFTESDR